VSTIGTCLVILGLIVLIGFIAFLSLSIEISRSLKSINTKIYGLVTLTTFIAFFFILFTYVRSEGNWVNQQPQTDQQTPFADPSISPSPTEVPAPTNRPTIQRVTTSPQTKNSNQVTCTGPDGKTLKATQKACDDFNAAWKNSPKKTEDSTTTNGLVDCNLSYGTFRITSDQCIYFKSQDHYSSISNDSGSQSQTSSGTSTNNGQEQLIQEQKQRCLSGAESMYYSNLRTCAIYRDYYNNETMARECESKYYQQYIKDKGACN